VCILGLDKKKRDDGILIGVAMKASLDWILEQPRYGGQGYLAHKKQPPPRTLQ